MSTTGPAQITSASKRCAQTVEAELRELLHSWRLIRTPAGTLHLITRGDKSDEHGAVCVTSRISAVARGRGAVTTSSRNQYELAGPAEEREIEREVLRAGAARFGMGRAVDVSVFAWDLLDLD